MMRRAVTYLNMHAGLAAYHQLATAAYSIQKNASSAVTASIAQANCLLQILQRIAFAAKTPVALLSCFVQLPIAQH